MPNLDITRYLRQPRKHYSGARLQQGRPILDSDFNEGAESSRHYLREALLDVVGPSGSPDFGFLPSLEVGDVVNAIPVRFGESAEILALNYSLKPGVMWAGGERWEQPESEPVIFQREFLQMSAATAPRAAIGQQRQLSYLRGWDQPVTSTEDGELLEPSLGGADTAARVRRIRRVEVRNVQAANCSAAFAEVLDELGHGDAATYNPATCELQSNIRLQMMFQGAPAGDCPPCSPSLEGRYLGSENHAIRIMLASPDRYVWTFDSAAPIYRVRLVLDGNGGARVDMQTLPKDTYHYVRQGQVVEFLPWEALLENGSPQGGGLVGEKVKNEKVAAHVGFFAEADETYDPSARTFHVLLAPEAMATLNDIAFRWDPQHTLANQLNFTETNTEGFLTYVYMRVWHVKQSDDPLSIPTSSTKPLGDTGLVPVFSGRGRHGDFYDIAVRPDAPDEILPREIMLEGGIPPHGPREVVAPICVVTWISTFGIAHQVIAITDCRPTLPSLTDRGCCTFDVGPGGDFESIQEALSELPKNGGRLCLRPGVYREEIRIAGLNNVVLEGCAGRTRIETPAGSVSEALVTIELTDSEHNISIRALTIAAQGQIAVLATGGTRVELRGLHVITTPGRQAIVPRTAIHSAGTRDVRITQCRVEMDGGVSPHAAVYVDCPGGALLDRNRIETRANQNGLSFAWGGIQIAGGSHDIEIRDNVIRGGRGHGITLGSVVFRALDGSSLGVVGAGRGQSNPEAPFAITGIIEPVIEGDREYFPEPQAAIDDIVITGNVIERTGASGISSLALLVRHDDRTIGPPLCFRRTTFRVMNLVISENQILNNVRQAPRSAGEQFAVGGIILSDAVRATIRGNLIEGNGAGTPIPICGVCLAHGEQVSMVANRIRNNGVRPSSAPPGVGVQRFHGGIVIAAPNPPNQPTLLNEDGPTNIHIARNVVDQPDAPAAFVQSRGACRITRNHFHSHRQVGQLPGPCVTVFSIGKPWEGVDLPVGEPSPDRWLQPAGSVEYLNGRAQQLPDSDGGALCFNDNHVTTNGATSVSGFGFGAMLVSTDHITVAGNQFAGQNRPPTATLVPVPHILSVGLTAVTTFNRVAETLLSTTVSMGAMAPMLMACAGNQLTHCPAIFGCENHLNPDYFLQEDNLVWFRPVDGRCEGPAGPVLELLRRLCTTLFGPTGGDTPGPFSTLRGEQT